LGWFSSLFEWNNGREKRDVQKLSGVNLKYE